MSCLASGAVGRKTVGAQVGARGWDFKVEVVSAVGMEPRLPRASQPSVCAVARKPRGQGVWSPKGPRPSQGGGFQEQWSRGFMSQRAISVNRLARIPHTRHPWLPSPAPPPGTPGSPQQCRPLPTKSTNGVQVKGCPGPRQESGAREQRRASLGLTGVGAHVLSTPRSTGQRSGRLAATPGAAARGQPTPPVGATSFHGAVLAGR